MPEASKLISFLLGPALIGLDPRRLGLVHDAMTSTMDGGHGAKSAVDIACWDLMGKAYGERVCDLLGGARMDPVSTYYVVPIGTPDDSATLAQNLQNAGHTKLQLKAGGRHIDHDIAAIHAVTKIIRPRCRPLRRLQPRLDRWRGDTGIASMRTSEAGHRAALRDVRRVRHRATASAASIAAR